ncbi:hypothetical protein LTR10_008091 [Elasticomyces elasticus]|nr:hypothetical protein LTR10_008091 [Elasticomyces elasticus]KAK4971089.1 hypothetical protein LTR42_008068 [Elasticomyces elasticus]
MSRRFYRDERFFDVLAEVDLTTHYEYKPFPITQHAGRTIKYPVLDAEQRQIRLLTFKSNKRRDVVGHFTVVSLNETPQYTALSYVWGAEPKQKTIYIDSECFRVRLSLFAYLKLAAKEKTIGHGIFIDAICINQSDDAEKSSQIALMGRLYENAFEVTVWFGAERSWVPRLVDKHRAILNPAVLRSCLLSEATVHLTIEDANEVRAQVRDSLLHHTYWSRIWTAQEYLLPRRLILRAGRLTLDDVSLFAQVKDLVPRSVLSSLVEDKLLSARRTISSGTRYSPQSKHPAHLQHPNFNRCVEFMMGRISNADTAQPYKGLLFRAILRFSEQECYFFRDRIFGLLGLCRSGIVPNIYAPVIELYIQALFECVTEIHRLYKGTTLYVALGTFIASLLSALGLRLDCPAVFLITSFAFGFATEERQKAIALVFEINMDISHPQLNDLLYNRDLLHLACKLQFKNVLTTVVSQWNGCVTGPDGWDDTVAGWVSHIDRLLLSLSESRGKKADILDDGESMEVYRLWQKYRPAASAQLMLQHRLMIIGSSWWADFKTHYLQTSSVSATTGPLDI